MLTYIFFARSFVKPAQYALVAIALVILLLHPLIGYSQTYLNLDRFTDPLVEAADNNDFEKVKVLLERGADPNARAELGATAIMRAAFNGNEEIVKILLKYGADPSLEDLGSASAIKMAKRSNNQRIVSFLLAQTGQEYYESDKMFGPHTGTDDSTPSTTTHIASSNSATTPSTQELEKRQEYAQYLAQLYEDFYSVETEYVALKPSASGVYAINASSNNTVLQTDNDHRPLKLTEAVEIQEIESNFNELYTNYIVHGFADMDEMQLKFTPQIAKFYFNNPEFESNYEQLSIHLYNKFSPFQGKKACARLMRRFRTLRCEVY